MLLAIDVGNTQTVLGLYDGETLSDHWRVATESHRSGDELGALVEALLPDLDAVDGVCLSSTVPALVRSYEEFVAPLDLGEAARARARRPHRRAGALGRSARGRAGPDRERRRRQEPLRRAGDRRRLRHVDELRRRVRGGGVARRRARPRNRDLDGRALRARGAPLSRRVHGAAERDRQDDGRVAAVGPRLRLHRPGRRDRRAHPGRARRRAARRRDRRSCGSDRAALEDDPEGRPVAHARRAAPRLGAERTSSAKDPRASSRPA